MGRGNIMKVCPYCDSTKGFRHLANTAHGIPGTHMAGSERFECKGCDKRLAREDAENIGFEYVIDDPTAK